MIAAFILLCVPFVQASVSPSHPPPTPPIQTNNDVIEGGLTPTNPEQFPTLVVMVILSESDQPREKWPMSVCSGTLLGTPDNPFVLTAKHCVDAANLVSLTMLGCGVGQWSQTNHLGRPVSNYVLQMYGEDTNVPDVVYLYPYARPASANEMFRDRKVDLALVPVKSAPSCGTSPTTYYAFSENAQDVNTSTIIDIAGYGLNTNKNNPLISQSTLGVLQYLEDLNIWKVKKTSNAWRSATTKRIYAATEEIHMEAGAKGIRGGDSGGPMFDKHKHVVGVASYTSMGTPMFSAHVSTTQPGVRGWIDAVLNTPRSKHAPHPSMVDMEKLRAQPVELPVSAGSTSGASSLSRSSIWYTITLVSSLVATFLFH